MKTSWKETLKIPDVKRRKYFGNFEMLIIVCLILFSNVCFFVRSQVLAVMEPNDPYVEDGGTLILNCTLTGVNKSSDVNSSGIYIRSKGINYTSPHVTSLDQWTAQFQLNGVNFSTMGTFCCMTQNKCLGKDAKQYVHVFRKPIKPKLTNCTLKQMKILECSWLPSVGDQQRHINILKPLKQMLQIFHARNLDDVSVNCSNNNYSGCSISLIQDHKDILALLNERVCARVILNISNPLFIEVHSDFKCWNLSETIYPEPPEFVGMTEVDGGCLLKWNQPFGERYVGIPLNFYLTLVPSYNKSLRFFLEVNQTSFLFKPCQPHTNYFACVSSTSAVGGFHSEITDFTFKTSPTVPCQSVDISPYLVFIDLLYKKLLFYWKPLPEKEFCGLGFHYVLLKEFISTSDTDNTDSLLVGKDGTKWIAMKNVSASMSFMQREIGNMCLTENCIFTFVPKNDQGYQLNNFSTFQWMANDNLIEDSITIDNFVSEIEEGFAFLSWNISDKIIITSSSVNTTTVIYICQTLFHSICRSELRWKVVESNLGHYNLSVDSRNSRELSYGVAVFVEGISLEIFWSKRIYNLHGRVLRPSQLAVKNFDLLNSSSVHVYWSFMQEECSNCSYVLYFTVFYCQTFDQKACNNNATQVVVSNNIRMIEIHNLLIEASYLVWMASSSRVLMSDYTDKIITRPSRVEIKYIILFCSAILIFTILLMILIFKYYNKCKKCKTKFCKDVSIDVPKYRTDYTPGKKEDNYDDSIVSLKQADNLHHNEINSRRRSSDEMLATDKKTVTTKYIPSDLIGNTDAHCHMPLFEGGELSPYSQIKPISSQVINESQEINHDNNLQLNTSCLNSGDSITSQQQPFEISNEINNYSLVLTDPSSSKVESSEAYVALRDVMDYQLRGGLLLNDEHDCSGDDFNM